MTTARTRLHTADVAARYGLKPRSLARRRVRDGFPPPDGYDGHGAWWYEDELPDELPSRPKGRPRRST